MRNIFDQYEQPENRLTHALACSLYKDHNLLKSFLFDLLQVPHRSINNLKVLTQSLPKHLENCFTKPKESKDLNNGLPDIVIYDETGWCVFVEAKVASSICKKQIERHFKTLHQRGFKNPCGVVISVDSGQACIPECILENWKTVYKWLCKFYQASYWAKETKDYFEILEKKMNEENYLVTGTITDFMGIPFCKDNPFNYIEGKRILKLMMDSLKRRKRFNPSLDVNYNSARGGISDQKTVWDVLTLDPSGQKRFEDVPHFTFGFTESTLRVMLTIPDKVNKSPLFSLEDICPLLSSMVLKLEEAGVNSDLYSPTMNLIQRHYPHRRKPPIIDGLFEFDLRTIPDIKNSGDCKVKKQKGWLDGFFSLYHNKSSNLQLQVGVVWSYQYLSTLEAESVLELVELSCNSMTELITLIKNL